MAKTLNVYTRDGERFTEALGDDAEIRFEPESGFVSVFDGVKQFLYRADGILIFALIPEAVS